MTDVILKRNQWTDKGVFGALLLNGEQLCYTLERPLTGEHPCISIGTYTFRKYFSPDKQIYVWLRDDCGDGRTGIEIHPANIYTQLLGCIAPGDSLGTLNGLPAILNSQKTFTMLKTVLPDVFTMTIEGEPS